MVWEWQLWLSPRPRNRTVTNTQTAFPYLDGAALYEPLSRPDGSWYIRETHHIENPLVKAGLSGPPLHIHRTQDEFFKVEQGVLGAVKDGVEYAITKHDGVFPIPAGTRHRFWSHKSATESLVFTIWLDPCKDADYILDVRTLRNSTSYLDDCQKAGLKPSIFQLILFWHNASSLACPPALNWMPIWMLLWVHRVVAFIAENILGYQTSYPEYTRKEET